MRSNMRFTWPANSPDSRVGRSVKLTPSIPRRGPAPAKASVQRGEEVREVVELLRAQVLEGGHDARPDLQRAEDRRPRDAGANVGQLRPRPVVAVLADQMTGAAARLSGHLLARLVLRCHRERDLVRGPGRRAG